MDHWPTAISAGNHAHFLPTPLTFLRSALTTVYATCTSPARYAQRSQAVGDVRRVFKLTYFPSALKLPGNLYAR
jgi:hypothetical protein